MNYIDRSFRIGTILDRRDFPIKFPPLALIAVCKRCQQIWSCGNIILWGNTGLNQRRGTSFANSSQIWGLLGEPVQYWCLILENWMWKRQSGVDISEYCVHRFPLRRVKTEHCILFDKNILHLEQSLQKTLQTFDTPNVIVCFDKRNRFTSREYPKRA